MSFKFYKGWAEEEGRKAGELDRQERGAKAKPALSERQHLIAARREYEEDMARKAEGFGKHPVRKAANQWIADAQKSAGDAGDAFAGLFDRSVN